MSKGDLCYIPIVWVVLLTMGHMSEDILKKAVDLYKSGDRQQAKETLLKLIKNEPRNARAWYGLAVLMDEIDQKCFCLQKVLDIQPGNVKAQDLLEKLRKKDEKSPVNDIESKQKLNQSQPIHQQNHPKTRKKTTLSTVQWIILITLGVLSIGGVSFAIFFIYDQSSQLQLIPTISEIPPPSNTEADSFALPDTWTPLPTNTVRPTSTTRPTSTPSPTNTQFVIQTETLTFTPLPQGTLATQDTPGVTPSKTSQISTPSPTDTQFVIPTKTQKPTV